MLAARHRRRTPFVSLACLVGAQACYAYQSPRVNSSINSFGDEAPVSPDRCFCLAMRD
jgi:hypothetical protein